MRRKEKQVESGGVVTNIPIAVPSKVPNPQTLRHARHPLPGRSRYKESLTFVSKLSALVTIVFGFRIFFWVPGVFFF